MPGCWVGLRRSALTYGKRYRIRGGAPRLCAIQIYDFTLFYLSAICARVRIRPEELLCDAERAVLATAACLEKSSNDVFNILHLVPVINCCRFGFTHSVLKIFNTLSSDYSL